jgi:hypothetical protein
VELQLRARKCSSSAASSVFCVPLQSLEGQRPFFGSEHRLLGRTLGTSCSLRCNETISECTEVTNLIRKTSRLGFARYYQRGVYSNSLEACVCVFPKRKFEKFALHSRQAQVNPSVKHVDGTVCTVYENAPSSPQVAAFVYIQSTDCPATEAQRHVKATELRYRHAASIDMDLDFLPSILFSDEAMSHRTGKVGRHNACIWGSENPHINRQVVRDGP